MRPAAVPSLSLLMPGMVTNYGVWYVQYAVPLAVVANTITKSVAEPSKDDTTTNKQQQQLLLQYWVLHALTHGILEQCSSILWWIPLSTHFTFLLWCYWNLDVSVRQWYPAVQQELQAFGLLPGETVQEWESTRTSRMFHMVVARLPSASNDDNTDNNNATDDVRSATAMDGADNVEPDPFLDDQDGGLEDGDDDDDEQEEYVPEAGPAVSTSTRGIVTRRSPRQRTTATAY
jgi:hypothetical protein